MPIWIRRLPAGDTNPLVPAVRSLSAGARHALHGAAASGVMRRGSWKGCAFSVAGAELGVPVRSRGEAACAFGTTPGAVREFIEVWDRLWGSNRRCTEMLRRAIEHVDLTEAVRAEPVAAGPEPDRRVLEPV